eukprot:CAMPEP_0171401626 /NCGR_PEP_ID=MMETSP0880-20121228/8024_1 /TAXON_ID=67004 /ORGANISM="Thalassiosira weissflogii, Strain CCMP1336" /LENGTH=89 /DNA_ID=CAMNT_0011916143 /DNA_START=74 /DNA_END=340 /DNA_ORIENTATION=-
MSSRFSAESDASLSFPSPKSCSTANNADVELSSSDQRLSKIQINEDNASTNSEDASRWISFMISTAFDASGDSDVTALADDFDDEGIRN